MIFIIIGCILLLVVGYFYFRKNKNTATKVLKVSGILGILLFLLRLGPAAIFSIINLILMVLPFLKKSKDTSSKMTKSEAREILGVAENADVRAIKKAFNQQMKKNHPDVGGSKYLAQKIIIAKKTLLGE
jgi:predicted membrane protein